MRVTVAAQGRAQRHRRLVHIGARGGEQAAQVDRLLAGERLDHAAGGHVADAAAASVSVPAAAAVGDLVGVSEASVVAAPRNASTR